jgi:hypothetical protein
MPTTPAQKPPLVPPIESVEQRFRRLEAQWKADTLVLSDPGKIMGHPAMRAIIAMGQDVVPLILVPRPNWHRPFWRKGPEFWKNSFTRVRDSVVGYAPIRSNPARATSPCKR